MKKRNFCPMAAAVLTTAVILQPFSASAEALDQIRSIAKSIISGEPKEVEELRQMEVAQSEEGHQEYYFKQLTEEEQRVYRELLKGIRAREKEFYLTISDDDSIDRSYHAVLKDHPEIFWVHNREKIYKTTYSDSDYCVFTPGYTYTDSEIDEIQTAMEQSFQEVRALIPEDAGDYEKVRIVYTYVIDHTQYQTGEDDQSIAGVFWKKSAVCAGYAGAVQYLLESVRGWVDEFDIDGLRLDVAYCLDENFVRRLRSFCDSLKPDFFLVGEMLHGDYNRLMNDSMLHSATNYECYKGLYSSFNSMNMFEIVHSLLRQFGPENWTLYKGKHLLSFVDNHDVTRVASILTNEKHLPLIYALMFGMPGIPCVYYGSEWGAKGEKS